MKNIIHASDGSSEGFLVSAVPVHEFNIQLFEPPGVTGFSDQAIDLIPSLGELFGQVSANKSAASGHKAFH
jgi:hypothetical protein